MTGKLDKKMVKTLSKNSVVQPKPVPRRKSKRKNPFIDDQADEDSRDEDEIDASFDLDNLDPADREAMRQAYNILANPKD